MIVVRPIISDDGPALPVQSVGRAMGLLAALAAAGPEGMALREIHRMVGLKPTTVHSLLRSLRTGSFVEQDQGTAKYRLGTGVLHLAGMYLQGNNWVPLTEQALQALLTETGETVQLGILQGDRHSTVRVLLSTHDIVAAPARVGGAPRLHCTALGKVLLAFAPLPVRTALVDRIEACGFQAFSPTTITARGALEAELERVRSRGGASNDEEGRPGVIGQAAAVRDYSGAVVAALGVAYPAMRRTPDYDAEMIAAVRRAADDASAQLGWRA